MEAAKELYVEGYAIVFNQKTLLYELDGIKYYEIIDKNALKGADLSDISFKYNHDDSVMIVATTRNNSLSLSVDDFGLKIVARLANTTNGRDLYELIRSNFINKMSFAFTSNGGDDYDSSTRTRTIKSIKKLYDVSAVDVPAYPGTNLKVMTEETVQSHKKRKRLQLILKTEMFNIEMEKEGKQHVL